MIEDDYRRGTLVSIACPNCNEIMGVVDHRDELGNHAYRCESCGCTVATAGHDGIEEPGPLD